MNTDEPRATDQHGSTQSLTRGHNNEAIRDRRCGGYWQPHAAAQPVVRHRIPADYDQLHGRAESANEVPPITNADAGATGTARVTFNLTRDAAGAITGCECELRIRLVRLSRRHSIILLAYPRGGSRCSRRRQGRTQAESRQPDRPGEWHSHEPNLYKYR